MAKFFVTFSAMLVLLSLGFGQAKSDRERANLVGTVKTVRVRSYNYMGPTDYKKDEKNSKLDTGDTVTYDVNGNEIKRIMVSDFGEALGKQTQTFDAAGLLKESVVTDPKGTMRERSVYTYSVGRLIEISLYDGKGILREKTKRSYDASGHLTEEAYFNPVVLQAKTVFSNDKSGNAVETAFFLSNGKKAYAPVGPCLGAHRVTMTYDDERRPMTKAIYETEGKVKKSWTYTYNERGQFAEQTVNSGGVIRRYVYEYEYDSQGNWTRSTVVDEADDGMLDLMLKATGNAVQPDELKKAKADAKMTSVTTREITYY